MASIAGLYGGNFGANQEDGSGGRVGFFGGLRSAASNAKKSGSDHKQNQVLHNQINQAALAGQAVHAGSMAAALQAAGQLPTLQPNQNE